MFSNGKKIAVLLSQELRRLSRAVLVMVVQDSIEETMSYKELTAQLYCSGSLHGRCHDVEKGLLTRGAGGGRFWGGGYF